ncbi:hypothetical protein CISIN_1g034835mg [Citrus sinensis]|uniref:Uncharacterized protein n=1 Tax=Citrus sinensis TaxID=2711 RepID=A0A067DYG3_CITSI|nr:hypothetical protein CISIN_1g034835mg [Citrus sinensis]
MFKGFKDIELIELRIKICQLLLNIYIDNLYLMLGLFGAFFIIFFRYIFRVFLPRSKENRIPSFIFCFTDRNHSISVWFIILL